MKRVGSTLAGEEIAGARESLGNLRLVPSHEVPTSKFSACPPEDDLAQSHTKAASAIKQMALGRMSMTLTLARLTDRKLTVSSAGMPPGFIHRAATDKIEEIAIEGMTGGSPSFRTASSRSMPIPATLYYS